ncbi:MAG TPA: glycosyltransferase [Trebonia sp.]|nr:glycosyltransferase [Trebonia sp.]
MRLRRALLAAALVIGVPILGPAALAAGRPASGGAVTTFRVDVSRYPLVGVVVTVPEASGTLPGRDFAVEIGQRWVRPKVRQLSPDDVELILAPDTALAPTPLNAERAAATAFLAGLPIGERTAIVDPSKPGILRDGLSADPAPAVATVATLAGGGRSSTAARLETALSGFTAGSQVRRAVVLTVAARQSLSASAAARFRAQLAASGTTLYVLDTTPGGAPGYDALAAGSGGFAARIRAPGDWTAALTRVTAGLGEQYYLRFTDTRPLPGTVKVVVETRAGKSRGVADLPVHNPIAPPPLPLPPVQATRASPLSWDTLLLSLAVLLIVIGIAYGLGMLLVSRRDPRRRVPPRREPASGPADDFFFVFVMPCLNEEAVIVNSLRRLLSIPGDNFVVMVIDDGSDDGTADVVSGMGSDRVWLLRRRPPNARQGKGEALNDAVRHLMGSGHLDGRDPDRVIVVVVDADGRLDQDALERVTPYFADPGTGAVQIGVRINNRHQSKLARMQDMEFVIYTEVFQRGRRHLGSVGLGGNGQFMRLSAMLSLGPKPWSKSLADDLDLGVRMIAAGWRNEYCREVAVHQQGVIELRRLIRQRSRWFQGHLQTWRLIPLVLRNVPRRARGDLLYHLTSPAVLLIASLLSASFVVSVANGVLEEAQGRDPLGWWVATTYALTFGPALAFSSVYWSREHRNGVGVLRTIMFAHMYVCYGMMWYASGWWAVGRTLRGQTGWAKTARIAESPVTAASTPGLAEPAIAVAPAPAAVPAPVPALAAAPGAVTVARQPVPPAVIAGHAAADSLGPTPPVPERSPIPAASSSAPAAPAASLSPAPAGGPPRRKRRRVAITASVASVAAVTLAAVYIGHHRGSPGGWTPVFSGYGTTSIAGSGASPVITLDPARATTPNVSHAGLIVSARFYGNFAATTRVRTVEQLRHGSAGAPHPWEVGWVIWHYTSDHRFYALTLEPTGWELSKQDPTYRGGERFLASGLMPKFPPGAAYTVGIVQVGGQITVSADGQVLTRFTDTQDPYLSGAFGFYTEDAQAVFDHVRIDQLPAPPAPPGG